jgi:gliding motility-associated-like protein
MRKIALTFLLVLTAFISKAQIDADFSITPSNGCSTPHTVFFTDQSTTPDTWLWNFGDGSTSRAQHPIHTYTSAGTFNVSLRITDTVVGGSSTKSGIVKVGQVLANFTDQAGRTSVFGCGPLTVLFEDRSASSGFNITSYSWDFGDGTSSTAANPTHVYSNAGTYNVSLMVTNSIGCSSTTVKPNFVQVFGPDVNFGPTTTIPTNPPITIHFNNLTTFSSPVTGWNWNFGDGSSSTSQHPSHTYTVADTFNVSLTVQDIDGCSRTFTRNDLVITKLLIPSLTVDSNVSCNGQSDGGITASAINGKLPYSFLWSNGQTTASATGLSIGQYKVTISDANGATVKDSVTITEPTALITSTVIDSNVSCNSLSNGGATASATGGILPYTYAWSNSASSEMITGVSAGTYTVIITDNNGCTASETAVITEPLALVASTTINNNVTCSGLSDGNVSASATGGTAPYNYLWSNAVTTASNNGITTGTYAVTVTDLNGCTSIASATTIVLDTIKPTVVTNNVTVYLDATGNVTITTTDVDNGSTDACGAPSLSLSKSTFSCADVGANTIQLIATDVNNNIDSASAIVTVVDTIKPTVLTKNVTVYLDASGNASITTTDFNNGSSDICGAPTLSLSKSAFTCTDVGSNTIQLIAQDVNNNIDSTVAFVTVLDSIKPTVITNNLTVYLDASGQALISTSDVNLSTTDICGISSITLSKTSFDCSNIGANTVYLKATDVNMNVDSVSTTITIADTIKPTVITNNITVYLDATGNVTIATTDIDNGSTDACGTPTLSLSKSSFTCTEIGANTIQLIATDANNNIDSANAIVTVVDSMKPTVVAQNATIYLDATGNATITTTDINNGSTDICGAPTLSLSKSVFSCTDVGANTIQLIAQDVNNNIDSSSAVVTVVDTIKPTIITNNITVYLDVTGNVTITAADINNGSTDICGTPTLSLSKSTFSCADVGANTIQLIATDVNNNIDSSSAIVTLVDTIKPTVIAKNITVYLDATGNATITTTDIDNGSADACGTPTLSLSKSAFTCGDVGANTIQLIATDANNNIDSTSAMVTVVDSIKPTVITQNSTIYLDATGSATITTTDINNGSVDICGAPTLSLSKSAFSCADVGSNTIQLIATDVNNNIDSSSAIVTVVDTIKPTVITNNITVYLNATGSVTITSTDIDNGSADACGSPTLSLSKGTFSCADVGANTIQLIATDVNNNIDSSSAIVTVVDTIKPTVITNNVTVYLDASGNATITTTDVDNGSADACGSPTLSLSKSAFSCADVGANTIQLIAQDANNNIDSSSSIVNVVDSIKPLISGCPVNITQNIDAGSCNAIATWTAPTAADNCGIDSLIASHNPNTTFSIGTTTVTYIAYDESLNTDTCSFTITIIDNEKPVISNLPADTVLNNDTGNCSAVYNWSAVTATDNCTLDSLISNFKSGDAFPIGTTTVTYTAYDNALNTFSASFTVTVNDTELPTIVCPSNISQCDSIVTWNSPIGLDNCVGSITNRNDGFNLFSGDQFPKGVTTISYQVMDASNNQATCSFDVEVYTPPTANAGPDLSTRDIEPIQILANTTNADQIYWTPISGLSDPTTKQPLANPRQNTTYTLTVVSADGCEVSDDVEILVELVTQLDATTLFTPNGDGRNDRWVVNKPELIAGCQLVIFNRNGTEVYSTNNYNNDWDGTIGGQELPEGTYYYIISCEDSRQYKGPITILRERR